jgi:hypothetical protein
LSVPVSAVNVIASELAEASSSVSPAPIVVGSLTVKLGDHALHCPPSLTRTHSVSVPGPLT